MASFITNRREPYDALTSKLATAPLAGKSVFVTGAGRGVGEFITRAMIEAGASRIGILGRNKERIDKAKERLTSDSPKVKVQSYAADITDESAIKAVFADFGAPDVLINNAGHFPDEGPFIEQNIHKWWEGFEINILGTAIVTQQFLKAKGPKKPATVLNVSSMAAHMRFRLTAWSGYVGSKMGQARIFEYIRFEHPEVRSINCHPGQIQSDGFAKSKAEEPEWGMTDGKLTGQFFAWLATEEAQFLSGRFVWAEWDVNELIARKDKIVEQDLLLMTVDGFSKGFM